MLPAMHIFLLDLSANLFFIINMYLITSVTSAISHLSGTLHLQSE